MSIFKNQSNLTITLETTANLSTAGLVGILAEKPNGSVVQFVGSVLSTTQITYSFKPGDLDVVGTWKLQAVAMFGRNNYIKSYGDIVTLKVLDNLEND